jgi:hypothetical protein
MMAESHIVSALRQKRGEIAGGIVVAERQINDLRASLVHVDATLKLFAGDEINPEAIRARIPAPAKAFTLPKSVGRGDLVRAVLDVLRRADGNLTAMEVTERAAIAFDVPADAARESRHPFRVKIEGTLYRQRDRGVLTSLKDGDRNVWRIVD